MSQELITYSCNTKNYDINLKRKIICVDRFQKFNSPTLNSRATKILSHKIFPSAKWTIWCDSNIWLRISLEALLEYFNYPEVGVFTHPKRNTIDGEIDICKLKNLDFHENHKGLLASTPILISKNTARVQNLNNSWMTEPLAGSHKDHLSFPYTLGKIAKHLEIPKIKGFEMHAESCNRIFLKIPHRHQILGQLKKARSDHPTDISDENSPEKIPNKFHREGKWHLDGDFKVPPEEGEIFEERNLDI